MIGVFKYPSVNKKGTKDLRSPSAGRRLMSECSEGENPDAQKECMYYILSKHKQGCVYTRKLNGFFHCSYYHKAIALETEDSK